MAEIEEWERLATLLDDEASVSAAARDAVVRGDDPWEALISALDDAGSLAYLQIDDTGMELTDALAQLPLVFAEQPDLDEATDTDDLDEATRVADRSLRHHGLRVVRLVEEDDAWPLVVVPADRLEDVMALVARVGQRAVRGG